MASTSSKPRSARIRELTLPEPEDTSKINEEALLPFLKGDIAITYTAARKQGLLRFLELCQVLMSEGFFDQRS